MVDFLQSLFFRLAPGLGVPASWFSKTAPEERSSKNGRLKVEIVSHCWQYSHFLIYQLSSLVNYPPTKLQVVMTVFYSEEDSKTKDVLEFIAKHDLENVKWNWQPLPKEHLFRRSIGRNLAAKNTKADWIWFADCDSVFHKGCLDQLHESLQGRNDILVYPSVELTTSLLAEDDPVLVNDGLDLQLADLDVSQCSTHRPSRATGPLQITHGDVARACGYCDAIKYFQKPTDRWRKTYEDSVFRWLLGTDGNSIDVASVYRIRHVFKGRYQKDSKWTVVRQFIRKFDIGYRK